jgi:hypothetical protein
MTTVFQACRFLISVEKKSEVLAFSKDSGCGDQNFNFFLAEKKALGRRLTSADSWTGAPGVKLTARRSSLDHYSPSSSLII